MSADHTRMALNWALDDAQARDRQATQETLRRLIGGCSWTDADVIACRERIRRAKADAAIVRQLLRELDELDAMTGEAVP
jgi:hypothetical protein